MLYCSDGHAAWVKTFGCRYALCYWGIISSKNFSRESKENYVCIPTCYIYISTNISVGNHLYLYSKHEFIQMSQMLIHNHMDYFSSHPHPLTTCLSVNSHFNSDKSGSHHLPFIYLVVHLQYAFIPVPELSTCTPMGKAFY